MSNIVYIVTKTADSDREIATKSKLEVEQEVKRNAEDNSGSLITTLVQINQKVVRREQGNSFTF